MLSSARPPLSDDALSGRPGLRHRWLQHLVQELDLLPDIAITEEARDIVVRDPENRGSHAIFDHIVAQPVRWQVMNDYTRHVELKNPPVARHGRNGDTAMVSTPAVRRDFTVLREQDNDLVPMVPRCNRLCLSATSRHPRTLTLRKTGILTASQTYIP